MVEKVCEKCEKSIVYDCNLQGFIRPNVFVKEKDEAYHEFCLQWWIDNFPAKNKNSFVI